MRERERSNARDDDDGYYDLDRLSRYSGLSVSTLRRALKDPTHPLPYRQVHAGGKGRGRLLVRKDEFDTWMDTFKPEPAAGADDFSWLRRRRI